MHIYGKSNRSTLFGSKWHGTCIPRSIMLIAEVKYHQRRLPGTEGRSRGAGSGWRVERMVENLTQGAAEMPQQEKHTLLLQTT